VKSVIKKYILYISEQANLDITHFQFVSIRLFRPIKIKNNNKKKKPRYQNVLGRVVLLSACPKC